MEKYKIAICDDDRMSMEALKAIVTKIIGAKAEFYEYSSGEELLKNIGEEHQLIILDVGLGGINGFETAEKVREDNKDAVLVFCSGEFDPTPEAIKVVPYRYLKKQYPKELMEQELTSAIKRVGEIFDREALVTRDREGNLCRLPIRQIAYIAKAKRGCMVHLLGESKREPKEYIVRKRLEELFEELATCGFDWPHSSYIVNMRLIAQMNDKELLLNDGVKLSVARSKYKYFVEAFTKYWGGKY